MSEKIERKLKKLAKVCAEANTWSDVGLRKTRKQFSDVWKEAFQLIKMTGHFEEYKKREQQIRKARK